jgi:hypothetical protein
MAIYSIADLSKTRLRICIGVRVKYFRESGWKEEGRETHIWELGKVSNQTNYQRRVSQDGFQMGRFGL